MNFLLGRPFCRGYVSFREGNSLKSQQLKAHEEKWVVGTQTIELRSLLGCPAAGLVLDVHG